METETLSVAQAGTAASQVLYVSQLAGVDSADVLAGYLHTLRTGETAQIDHLLIEWNSNVNVADRSAHIRFSKIIDEPMQALANASQYEEDRHVNNHRHVTDPNCRYCTH